MEINKPNEKTKLNGYMSNDWIMTFESLINEFESIVYYYAGEINHSQTRQKLMSDFKDMIESIRNNGHFNYILMKRFVDISTPELVDQNLFEIKVELINENLVTLDEYFEILTDKEKYGKLLWEGINNFKL